MLAARLDRELVATSTTHCPAVTSGGGPFGASMRSLLANLLVATVASSDERVRRCLMCDRMASRGWAIEVGPKRQRFVCNRHVTAVG
jgi:hypothetical protein